MTSHKHGRQETRISETMSIVHDATDISPEVIDAFATASEGQTARNAEIIERYLMSRVRSQDVGAGVGTQHAARRGENPGE